MSVLQLIIYGVIGFVLLIVYMIIKKKVFGSIRGELPEIPKKYFVKKKSKTSDEVDE